MAAVCIMPSAMPSLSVFWRNGVTRVTYLAPLQGLSRFSAQRSVSPPTLSRIRSNLEVERGRVGENKRHKQRHIRVGSLDMKDKETKDKMKGRIRRCGKKRTIGQMTEMGRD